MAPPRFFAALAEAASGVPSSASPAFAAGIAEGLAPAFAAIAPMGRRTVRDGGVAAAAAAAAEAASSLPAAGLPRSLQPSSAELAAAGQGSASAAAAAVGGRCAVVGGLVATASAALFLRGRGCSGGGRRLVQPKRRVGGGLAGAAGAVRFSGTAASFLRLQLPFPPASPHASRTSSVANDACVMRHADYGQNLDCGREVMKTYSMRRIGGMQIIVKTSTCKIDLYNLTG
eukprot:CAMPEP_0204163920 /NCGR_PEP_ID=MMETSP0361-20130328/36814_1 /ASSEMBLY_ACC=CAM_ASM_000343 /TAXON_ID=268821 /ORGANISM="Scrippsiella Hangoei, Strain SHTV-5" /LENGTH=229 /DNA_ID=CAMNT_0051120693 /DNA_START=40 /DNA_END=725 /DNA_ORIENTATION=-